MKVISKVFFGLVAGLFLFTACSKEPSNPIERSYSNIDFKKIDAGDQHRLTITKGTGFSIIARGEERDVNDLVIRVIDSS